MTPAVFLFVTSLTFITLNLYSQHKVNGTVKEGGSQEPMEFAQVSLMHKSDSSLITGGITDFEGKFEFSATDTGNFLLRISFIGYNELWEPVRIVSGRNRLGYFALEPSATVLGGVEVSAAAALFRSEADRRVFSTENMTIAEGGSAIQLLEALPSVQVDQEGNLSLRGSGNILIYINGRPTNLSSDETESILEQYPASVIREVELITNPSARYDAEGIGGIINLILKESVRQGFNGQVNLSAGTGNKYSAGLNLNYRHNKLNIFTNYAYQYREQWEETHSFRERFTGEGSPILDHDYHTINYLNSHLLRSGLDYELNENSTARIFANINYRSRDRERTYNIRNMASADVLDSLYVRQLEEDQSRINYEFGAMYGWKNGNGRNLNIQGSWAWDSQDRIEYFDQLFYDSMMNEVPGKRADQTYERPLTNQLVVFQADYEHPLNNNRIFEAGIKSTLQFDDREQIFNEYDFESQEYVLNDWITNQFSYDEQIHAAYLIYRDRFGKLSYQAGLRGEYTLTESYQPEIDSTYTYHYFLPFPSLFLSYEISQHQDIQANYSRRIRRPRQHSLAPFINAQDFFNLRLGNPYLQPEHTDNYEINYIRAWQRFMFTGGVFHRYTTNALTRVFILVDDATMVTWTNADTRNATGVEIINYYTLSNNFDVTLTGNFFHSEISGDREGESFSNQSYSWSLSLLGNMNLPGYFSSQLTANYEGPRVIPQGSIRPVFSMNLGFRRNVLNRQGTVSLTISDVFNTRRFSLETNGTGFYQEREFKRESRVVTLSFTWRFRGYLDRTRERSENGFNGDVEGLF